MNEREGHADRSQPGRRDPRTGFAENLTRHARFVGPSLLAVLALVGCATSGESGRAPEPAAPGAAAKPGLGQVALLRAIGGSAVTGRVRVVDHGDGAMVTVAAFNLPIGEFRIAIQQIPNCTSPNGFSAGPAWAPPDSKRPPADLVPTLYANSSGTSQASVKVAGLRATGVNGVAGHSVVVYAGSRVTEARPDVPNERIACGVFDVTEPLQF
ncbi:MAG TPA: superoxide dismutase family protein [Casimicrobiaceae bacterium]|nr:superoxide dismutase family protein [Casimicrobiaceae bacterium]